MQNVRRVLLISYVFPPAGGAGVQRSAKFTKYLPAWGWEPTVLTVANPSVPTHDESLLSDLPAGTRILRTRTWEPSYAAKQAIAAGGCAAESAAENVRRAARGALRRLVNLVLQPDPQILWRPSAVRAGLRLLSESPHAAIVATGPPFSAFLIGAALSRQSRLPLVLDYRDEWDVSNSYLENKRLDRLSLAIQKRMQQRVVRAAARIVATSTRSADSLRAVCQQAGSAASVDCLYNGFDPDDFCKPLAENSGNDRYRLAYVGTLWKLTTAAPLVEAVRHLHRERPDLAAQLELTFAGRKTPAEERLLERLNGLPTRVERRTYINHHEAVALMRSSDGLGLLLADVADAARVVPAKIFEYMAARRTIFAIAPQGEVWSILQGYPNAHCLEPSDVAGICRRLVAAIEARRDSPRAKHESEAEFDLSPYDRKSQAGQLARILEETLRLSPVTRHARRSPFETCG